MQTVSEYIIKPFRLGEISINAIWIEGRPFFVAHHILSYLGVEDKADVDWSELWLITPQGWVSEKIRVYSLKEIIMIATQQTSKTPREFREEIANFLNKHWEDVPEDQEGK
jgi:hypothetical protein